MNSVESFLTYELSLEHPACDFHACLDGRETLASFKSDARSAIREKLAVSVTLCPPAQSGRVLVKEEAEYTVYSFTYQLEGPLECPCYELVPKHTHQGVVLAFNGHGYGVKDIVGLLGTDSCQQAFACSLIQQGLPVYAPEFLDFGVLRLAEDIWESGSQSSCYRFAMHLLAAGKTLLGMRILQVLTVESIAHCAQPERWRRKTVLVLSVGVIVRILSVIAFPGCMRFTASRDSRFSATILSEVVNDFDCP